MNLRTRLILSYTFIVVLCVGIIAAVVLTMLEDSRDRFLMSRLDDMTVPVYLQIQAAARRELSWNEMIANLEELAEESRVSIILADGNGNVLTQVSPEGTPKQRSVALPAGGIPVDAQKYRGTYRAPNGHVYMFAAYPLVKPGTESQSRLEVLVLAVPRSGTLALWGDLIRPFLWGGLGALVISIVIAVLLARSVYRPVRQLTQAVEKMTQGQYDQTVDVTGPREVRGLAAAFNQMARQVKRTEERLRYFVADVSHELRTPLTSIRGFAQAILDGTAGDDDARLRAAQVIEDESDRMIRQVNELLELSRMESGQIDLAREPVDVKDLLEHCREVFSLRAEEQGTALKTEIEPLMPVVGDVDRLEQVFSNLLDNALKHSPAGGEVRITGRNGSGGNVEIAVADSGPGIPPEQLPYVFDRFYKAGAGRTGSGLGLAIVREIVLAHNGKIDLKSAPGEGTEFTVVLPSIVSVPPAKS